MIEIIDGHDCGSYFWIMPVKVLILDECTDHPFNIDEDRENEISVEETIVDTFLYRYLMINFDSDLIFNKNRVIWDNQKLNFEWHLTYNFFTFNHIEKILYDINQDIKFMQKNLFLDYESIHDMASYLSFYHNPHEATVFLKDLDYSLFMMRNKEIIIDFYKRFIYYMERMMNSSKEKGYSLISFMGP